MATELTMPKMGFDMTEGKLAQWLKQVGDPVKRGEAIAEIETDKVNIEVEAPDDGVLRGTFLEPGQTVPVGTLIGIVGKADESINLDALRKKTSGATAPAEAKPEPVATAVAQPAAAAAAPSPTKTNGRTKASPLARRMAQEAGVNLADITGSGPGGRIVKRDVDAVIAEGRATPTPTNCKSWQATPA